ncbi:MAG: proton-conducting transporter membrane subunit [Planctomycetota bacterium]
MIPALLSAHDLAAGLIVAQIAAPAATLVGIGLPAFVGRPPSERATTRAVAAGFGIAFLAAVVSLGVGAARGFPVEVVHLGTLFSVGHHAATVELVADGLSIPYVCFSTGLCSLVNAFAGRYLHREVGFIRFFILLSLFGFGMNLLVLAGSIDVLFAGWECVGISSTLLIGFFHERRTAIDAALRAFITYRICDMGLLAAGVVIHHAVGSGDFGRVFAGPWPTATCLVPSTVAVPAALLLVFAALGKSAQVPLSGWLPRAMEGPTPSSAIFYGALSIHAGAYLLLRCEPLLDAAPGVARLLVAIGLVTAIHAAVVGSVQTDLKGMLAYASMTQAGLILAEIGIGWRIVPLVHVISHAILRSLQILRSPSALHDRHELSAALGGPPGQGESPLIRLLPASTRATLYRIALDRGFEDAWVGRLVVAPVLTGLRAAAAGERRLVAWLGGSQDVAEEWQRDRGAA